MDNAAQPAGMEVVQDISGTTVGRFAIRQLLGRGGMGEVYLAEDKTLKRLVALKRIAPRRRSDPEYRQRFLREATLASRINDPNVANTYDVFEHGDEVFLVMEYVEGQTLRQRLRESLDVTEFLGIATQCASGLAAAHQCGILHRDLKPENIRLTPDGKVKILDFGIARRMPKLDETTLTETSAGLSGTPAYMSPEIVLEKDADGRADIFSLGVVFYEALAGRNPFAADSMAAVSHRILRENPLPLRRLNAQVPAHLERIVSKMLAKKPAERYAGAGELLADLRALTTSCEAPTLPPFPAASSPRRRYARPAMVAALAIILAAAGIALWRIRPPSRPAAVAQRVRVAVLPFVNRTGEDRLDQYRLALAQVLVQDLTGSQNIQILAYERLEDITRGFEGQGKDFSSPEAVQAVGSYSNSQFVVVPVIFSIGKTLRVTAEFRDAQNGQTVATANVERALAGSTDDTLYSMLGPLEDRIQAYFKEARRGTDYQTLPETSRPKTAVAALHVNEGRSALARGDYAQALDSFQQAMQDDRDFPLPYAWTGQIDGLLGYDDKAREFSTKAAEMIRPDTPVTEAYFIEANLAERKYDFTAAEAKYRDLIRLFPDDPGWHARLAAVYENAGEYAQAISSYQEALRQDANYIAGYEELGVLYSRTGDLAQAMENAQKALNLYRALNNREGQVSALCNLGELERLKADYGQATIFARSALQLAMAAGDEFGRIRATKLLGDYSFNAGRNDEARRYYQQVISASTGIHNNRLLAMTLMNLGVTYSVEGDLAKTIEYVQRSLDQGKVYGEYKDIPSFRSRAYALSNLGSMFIDYGPEPEQGFELVQQALPMLQTMNDVSWTAHDHMLLGIYYGNTGQYTQAIQDLSLAPAAYQKLGDKRGLALANYNIGRYYFLQNEYELAQELFASALQLAQGAGDLNRVADCEVQLGWTYARLGDMARAGKSLTEALQLIEKNHYGELLPAAYDALGEFNWEAGETARARENFERASALWKEPYIAESSIEARSSLGLLVAGQGNSARGMAECQQALARAEQEHRAHTVARNATNLARVYLLRKEYQKASDVLNDVTSPAQANLGLELRAQAFFYRGKALEGAGRNGEAAASYSEAKAAISKLEETIAMDHRNDFAARPDIKPLLAVKLN